MTICGRTTLKAIYNESRTAKEATKTTQLTRWEPLRELATMRHAMDRLLEESFHPLVTWQEAMGRIPMPVDMYQTDHDVVVKATLPGLKPEDVDISISGDTLTIRGEQKEEREEKKKDYVYRERRYGSYYRALRLPVAVRSDESEAVFENGVLTLTLPKAGESKPKQIKVRATAAIEAPKKGRSKK